MSAEPALMQADFPPGILGILVTLCINCLHERSAMKFSNEWLCFSSRTPPTWKQHFLQLFLLLLLTLSAIHVLFLNNFFMK